MRILEDQTISGVDMIQAVHEGITKSGRYTRPALKIMGVQQYLTK